MPTYPPEPPRQDDLNLLVHYVRERVERVIAALESRGFDPRVFETYRTQERQNWLRHSRPPRSWKRHSRHQDKKAADVISRSRFWGWDEFFDALKEEALREGLKDFRGGEDWDWDRGHIEWDG